MKIIFCVFVFSAIFSGSIFAQDKELKGYDDPQNMEVKIDREPYFPGGQEELKKIIFDNIRYRDEAKNKPIIGEILLSFYVETDSTLSDIAVLQGVGYGIDEEVVRIMKGLRFVPSIQNKTPVKMNVIQQIPVRIRIE